MKAIILAGGGGTRLWPLSREDFPKQFLHFGSGVSLLQATVKRLLAASFIDEVIVTTNSLYSSLVQQQLEKIELLPKVKILIEPERKNTAPAIGFSVKYLQAFCHAQEEEAVLVLPSDHLIEPQAVFLESLRQMERVAQSAKIVTFGICPTKPETGYGYIQIGKEFRKGVFVAERFVEKPNFQLAEQYVRDSRYYWNAGIFLFSIRTFWREMGKCAPALYERFNGSYEETVNCFHEMPDVSIDYALMEKSREILVCPLAVAWSDVGSWDSVYEILEKDQNQNVQIGQVLALDTKNSLILGKNRLISTIGLEDMLIVETEDALFISKKGESQRVKSLVKELGLRGRKEGLRHTFQNASWGSSRLLDQTEEYTIQKICIAPGQSLERKKQNGIREEWVSLNSDCLPIATESSWLLTNSTQAPLEWILIERYIFGEVSPQS